MEKEKLEELIEAGRAIGKLVEHRKELEELLEAIEVGEIRKVEPILREIDLWPHCHVIWVWVCWWVCRWQRILLCH